jgi:four helix bundle protein
MPGPSDVPDGSDPPSGGSAAGGGAPAAPQSYRDLHVWQQGMDLAARVYRLTLAFPDGETHGLRADLRRAAARIPATIARGWGHHDRDAYVQALDEAHATVLELETQLLLAFRLGFILRDDIEPTLEPVALLREMILVLLRRLGTV